MTDGIDVLLFDLGGVVVPWVGIDAIADQVGHSPAVIRDRFESSDILHGHQIGTVDDETFLAELKTQFDLKADIAQLAVDWNSWVHPPFPGVIEAIQSLQGRYRTACLSNTNALHWSHLHQLFDVQAVFEPALASHDMQLAKPDPEIFKATVERIGVPASHILFFDDTMDNVRMARQMGLQAEPVESGRGVLPVLKRLGFVS